MISKPNNWKTILLASIPYIILFSGYYSISVFRPTSLVEIVLKGFTNTGYVFIGFSLLIGTLAKFWNFFDKYLHYRKQLGIIGFLYIMIHGIVGTLIYVFPNPNILWESFWAIALGLLALYGFFICMMISEVWVIKALGPQRWRKILRYTSFTAYTLAWWHILLVKLPIWAIYFHYSDVLLPPVSLFTFAFATMVLSWRLSVFIYDLLNRSYLTHPQKTEIPSVQ